jgi:hypothetical protein
MIRVKVIDGSGNEISFNIEDGAIGTIWPRMFSNDVIFEIDYIGKKG